MWESGHLARRGVHNATLGRQQPAGNMSVAYCEDG